MAEQTKSVEWVKIDQVKPNPDNPREITEDDFKRLKKSIEDFPEMLTLRPLVVRDSIVLGGNMRLEALKQLGYKKAPVLVADELTDDQIKEFVIKDNVPFGKWDWEKLANEWESADLNDWGLEVWQGVNEEELEGLFPEDEDSERDFSEGDSKNKITLEYTEDDYNEVIEALKDYKGQTKEKVIYDLLCGEK